MSGGCSVLWSYIRRIPAPVFFVSLMCNFSMGCVTSGYFCTACEYASSRRAFFCVMASVECSVCNKVPKSYIKAVIYFPLGPTSIPSNIPFEDKEIAQKQSLTPRPGKPSLSNFSLNSSLHLYSQRKSEILPYGSFDVFSLRNGRKKPPNFGRT